LLGQVGAFREVKSVLQRDAGANRAVILTTQFEGMLLDVRVVFDADGRITGLFFAPSQAGQPPWTPPGYVQRDAFDERDIAFGNAPWTLPGKLCVPKGDGPFPAVVLVHGSGPNDEDESIGPNKMFRDLAWGLASRGVAVLRYVKRSKQFGAQLMAIKNFTVMDETVDDARLAVEALTQQPGIDPKRIYVAGHSLGAMLAPRIATRQPRVAGIILLAGNTRPMDVLVPEQVEYLIHLDGQVSEAEQKALDNARQFAAAVRDPNLQPEQYVDMLGAKLPGSYILDLRAYEQAAVASMLEIPILILQGERDYQVRMADFEGWKKALSGRGNVSFQSYAALNHYFMPGSGPPSNQEYSKPAHVAGEVIQDIAEWILSRKPSP
jgi:hypothetical protein